MTFSYRFISGLAVKLIVLERKFFANSRKRVLVLLLPPGLLMGANASYAVIAVITMHLMHMATIRCVSKDTIRYTMHRVASLVTTADEMPMPSERGKQDVARQAELGTAESSASGPAY